MMVGIAFHIVAAVIWVGGMFFALMILRPSAGPLESSARMALWDRVLSRFFPWVWLCVAALLVSGFAMVFLGFGGFAAVGAYVHAMMAAGILMMAIYAYLYFGPWQRFDSAVKAADWAAAEKTIGRIRLFVTINLILGLVTVVVGASGRYF